MRGCLRKSVMGCGGLGALVVIVFIIASVAGPGGGEGQDEGTRNPETVESEASSIDPAPYAFVEHERNYVLRERAVGRIEIEPAGPEATGAALAAAARDLFGLYPQAVAVTVFGFNDGDDIEGGYTRGKAEATLDEKGWAGNGESSFGKDDDGQIQVYVGNALSGDEEIPMDFPR